MRGLCLIGVSAAGGGQKRIAVGGAAAAGGHVPTLLQDVKAAALHLGCDVGAAVLTGARRCCHRDKASASLAEVIFKNCFILFFPFGPSPKDRGGMPGASAPSTQQRKQRISPLAPAKDRNASRRGYIEVCSSFQLEA